jgi:hypothetical protein
MEKAKANAYYSWQNCPRGRIFRRDVHKVQTMASLRELIRFINTSIPSFFVKFTDTTIIKMMNFPNANAIPHIRLWSPLIRHYKSF